jgi:hypothetical protein
MPTRQGYGEKVLQPKKKKIDKSQAQLAAEIEPGTVGTGFSGLSSTVDVNTAA